MSYTQITVQITDQLVQLVNVPLLASGSEGVLQVKCEFDSLWTGYGKTAVFYKDKSAVYHVPMVDDVATIPHEVLTDEGRFYFGVFGTASNTRTTEVVALDLKQGAITFPTATPEEPTPNIYEQLLANQGALERSIALEHARINELVAMRNAHGALEYLISDDYISGSIESNGANAYINLTIAGLSLVAGGQHYTDYYIDTDMVIPLTDVELNVSNPDLNVTLLKEEDPWSIRILVENVSSTMYSTDMVTTARATYPIYNIIIPELADIRTSLNGGEYGTAGDAVRYQVEELQSQIDDLNENGGGGGGGGTATRLSSVTLPASRWTGGDSLFSQVVTIAGVTQYTKVDLLPSVEQLAVFYNKNVTFVTENEDGVVTVYAIGDKPLMDHTIQVQLTEVVV